MISLPGILQRRPEIAVLLFVLAAIGLLLWANRRNKILTSYFSAVGHPLTLAVVRIVVFSGWLLTQETRLASWFSGLPSALQVPPLGWGPVLKVLPVNPVAANIVTIIFFVACWASILGLFTRPAIWTAIVSGIYVFGIPQFYGKVNHIHYYVWFAIILGLCRCSDVLSLDAVRKAIKRADEGDLNELPPSRAYALPIRFMWILFGVVYFFPGIWKAFHPGWVTAEHMKSHLYKKWAETPGWFPMIRVDEYPTLLALLALGAVLFEISFPFLVLTDFTRKAVAWSGLLFHNLTFLMMRIGFWGLQFLYLVFVDWHTWLSKVGTRMFPTKMTVAFDGGCGICRRTIGVLKVLDLTHRVEYVNGWSDQANLTPEQQELLMTNMLGFVGDRQFQGVDVYREIAARNPLFWAVYPFFILGPTRAIGDKIYRHVADSRTCSIQGHRNKGGATPVAPAPVTRALRVGAAALLTICMLAGISGRMDSWPFACFPTFAYNPPTERPVTVFEYDGAQGHVREVLDDDEFFKDRFGGVRWLGLLNNIRNQKGPRQAKMYAALLDVMKRERPDPTGMTNEKFEIQKVPYLASK